MFDSYAIPKDLAKEIERMLRNYKDLEDKANQLTWMTDYVGRITPVYGSIPTSRTNNISRPTEEIALINSEKAKEQMEAKRKMAAIEKGVARAVDTCNRLGEKKKIRQNLWNNMVLGYPRDELKINQRTLTKYRKRAIYYIAVELGKIKDREL